MRLRCAVLGSVLFLAAGPAHAQTAPDAPEAPDGPTSPDPPIEEPLAPPPPATASAQPPPQPPPPPTAAPPPIVVPPPRPTASPASPPAPRPVTAPPPAAAAPAAASPPPAKDEDEPSGLFGPFRIGPVVGVGVPNLVSFGVTAKLTRFLGFGVNVGIIPKVHIALYGDAKLSYQEYDVYGRLYPFGGSFFLGAGVGYATMKGSFSTTMTAPESAGPFAGQTVTLDSDGKVRSLVLTPQLGFFKTYGNGLSIGVDVGAQVPIAPSKVDYSSTTSVDGNEAARQIIQENIAQSEAKVRDTLERVGQQIVPTLNFKIGFLL